MIRFEHLMKEYSGRRVVDDLTFQVPQGEIFGLIGPNGAGKSTTILMLVGLIEPTGGRCLINGEDIVTEPIRVKHRIGYMPEDVGFYADLTAARNLDFFAQLYGMKPAERKQRIEELLALVGLDGATQQVGAFSKGMRQRLGLAGALLNDPAVLVLDEPTANLDPPGVADFRRILRDAAAEGRTILISSHILPEVDQICTSVGVLARGRLVAMGTPGDLLQKQEGGTVTLCVETRDPMPDLAVPGVLCVSYDAPRREALVVAERDLGDEIAAFLVGRGVRLLRLAERQPSLESVVLPYYREV
ncbi:ABC transporter ATP-binding protein [Methanoculleus palmolei]|uniref:ABC transporter ATP-binding protein n=1 Tax=Methanoculleus palmolei TaxID=72612 RepID=A0ABD8A954_9EURY|nr:ABC transporter ATP-binding protein [Methanoculleus palmolei]